MTFTPTSHSRFSISRRSFLSSALIVPALSSSSPQPYRFRYDGVLGTSMELTVWARTESDAANAEHAALDEITRLETLISTYQSTSEISRLGAGALRDGSTERADLLRSYDDWQQWSGGAVSSQINGRLNVDALGKAFVVDRVTAHLSRTVGGVDGVLLNIGGDIVATGPDAIVDVVDPGVPEENAEPITRVRLRGSAIATSGSYARPGHLIDPRTGAAASGAVAATVIAAECVAANALATALCVLAPEAGLALVERTPGAEALIITGTGATLRSSGFAAFELPGHATAIAAANWPAGYDVRMALKLTGSGGPGGGLGGRGGRGRGGPKSPYVALWVDDARGKPVRTVTVWGDKWRYLSELTDWWALAKNNTALNTTATRATRPAGEYTVIWNGLDDKGAPVPAGSYRINLEVSREHGTYARRDGQIVCGDAPATLRFTESAEFAPVLITYGPKPVTA